MQEFCQSCGMPLVKDVLGTNQDGSKNEDYCSYCYKDGAFTADCTMEEMAAFCAPMMAKHGQMTEQEATERMLSFFPKLKRWAK